MDPCCLDHILTESERATFERQGYLTLHGVLSARQLDHLEGCADRIHARRLSEGHPPTQSLFCPNFLPEDPEFLDLIDHPRVFPKVWGILGWNIYLYHCHLIVTPPLPRADWLTDAAGAKTFGWHQDSGRVNIEIECRPRPRLSLKTAWFLSDCSEPNRGNFWIVPGSHVRDELPRPESGTGQPEGAIPVCVPAGSVVFFDRRLWHSASPNWSSVTRKVLFYGYGYRWIRTKDDMTVRELWPGCSPIRRQILGDGVNCNGFYSPTDADVPLRGWLKEHHPDSVTR